MNGSHLGLRLITGSLGLTAVVLSALAIPSSWSHGLESNNDAACLYVGTPLFLWAAIALLRGSAKDRWWTGLLVFGVAWLVQLVFLTWIEGTSWTDLLQSGANDWLVVWARVYKWCPVLLAGNAAATLFAQAYRWRRRAEV